MRADESRNIHFLTTATPQISKLVRRRVGPLVGTEMGRREPMEARPESRTDEGARQCAQHSSRVRLLRRREGRCLIYRFWTRVIQQPIEEEKPWARDVQRRSKATRRLSDTEEPMTHVKSPRRGARLTNSACSPATQRRGYSWGGRERDGARQGQLGGTT